ncbi:hypothetical protein TrRE_jg7095, partial [Triparma retinervis]
MPSDAKIAAKAAKSKLIAESGGVRPRKRKDAPTDALSPKDHAGNKKSINPAGKNARSNSSGTKVKTTIFKKGGGVDRTGAVKAFEGKRKNDDDRGKGGKGGRGVSGKFGKVMSVMPSLGMQRFDTVSMAVPTSVVANAQTKELKTYLIGQISRAATIYNVDEIVVYEDLSPRNRQDSSSNFDRNPLQFMVRLLQYAETPPYLKRSLFPNHSDLQFVGLLPPADAPHHVRKGEQSKWREGVTLKNDKEGEVTRVNCGIGLDVELDIPVPPGNRVTVEIPSYTARPVKGRYVPRSEPREKEGLYWGYDVRAVRGGLKGVLEGGE